MKLSQDSYVIQGKESFNMRGQKEHVSIRNMFLMLMVKGDEIHDKVKFSSNDLVEYFLYLY